MDVESDPKVIPKTLAELIAQETPIIATPPISHLTDYEVYPEVTNDYDFPRNPYSRA